MTSRFPGSRLCGIFNRAGLITTSSSAMSSQLHQEALRRQKVIDKRHAKVDTASLREQLERQTSSSRGHSTTGNSVGQHGGHLRYSSSNHSHISTHSSCMTRNQGPQIVDPYLDTITKETKARTRNRFSSADYMMQW